MSALVTELRKRIRGDVYTDTEKLKAYSIDTSLFRVMPRIVVAPKDVQDVRTLIWIAEKYNTSLTARSAGTDMTGGPLNEEIIVDFLPYFTETQKVQDATITTQPGVYYRDLDIETQKEGLIMPSYPASRDICTVGGMVANDAGGEKTLRYGKTADYVRSLNVVLSDGKVYRIQPLTLAELKEKETLDTFEGTFYREIHALVRDNQKLLQEAKPDVSKNASGYALWNVLDEKKGIFDLTRLFTGSQGTLGLITEITFGLVTPKTHSRLLVIFLKDMDVLADLIQAVLKQKPESFESYDDHTFRIALKLFPQIVKRLKGNLFSLGLRFIPEFFRVLTGGVPKLVLLAEFTGDSDAEAYEAALHAKQALRQFDVQTRITTDARDAEKYWVVRRESFALLQQKVQNLRTAPFIEDLIVRPEVLPEFLPKLYAVLDEYDITYTIAGHMGDGNFHIIPLMDMKNPESLEIIDALGARVRELVWSYHGSNTAEHNDGILRTPYLPEMYGEEVYALFEKTKHIFDPHNIFNPGKKVGGSVAFRDAHIIRE